MGLGFNFRHNYNQGAFNPSYYNPYAAQQYQANQGRAPQAQSYGRPMNQMPAGFQPPEEQWYTKQGPYQPGDNPFGGPTSGNQPGPGTATNTQTGANFTAAGDTALPGAPGSNTSINVNAGGQQGQQQAQPAPVFGAEPVPPAPWIDPFAQTELGMLLRGISSAYARGPYSQGFLGQSQQGQYIPGSPIHQPPPLPIYGQQGQQPQGDGQQQQGAGAPVGWQYPQPPQATTPQQRPEYLGPIGPLEWSVRAGMLNQLMNMMPAEFGGQWVGSTGPFSPSPMDTYLAQVRGRGTRDNFSGGGLHPERWDPYAGLYTRL